MKELYLVLADGKIYKGFSCGAEGEVIGEVVFNTSMTGYLESLSDPSYTGQILVQSFPLIGNYGVIGTDLESGKVHVSGYVVKEICEEPSNFRSEGGLSAFLKKYNIPAICGIDTRSLVKRLREYGVINGIITSDPASIDLQKVKEYSINEPVKAVSLKKNVKYYRRNHHIALIDFGYKKSILDNLTKRDCSVTVFPYDFSANEILEEGFEGVVLSNGPGDPKDNTTAIGNIKKLMNSDIPLFGICLGHQLMALAAGGDTNKLRYGHRGANQPVRNEKDGKIYITSQNHGYAVSNEKLPLGSSVLFFNLNDGTVEGLEYDSVTRFSVQFHPEASGGPHDTEFLFDDFVNNLKPRNECHEQEHVSKDK